MSFIRRMPLGDRLMAIAAVLLAVAYTVSPGGVSPAVAITQAVVSWCFIPFFLVWRTRPVIAAAGMLTCLGLWAASWLMQLPYNAGFSPWLVAAPMALYTTARYCADRRMPRAILAITLLGSAASPAMWQLADDLTMHYRRGTDAIFALAFHWLLLFCTTFVAVHLRDKEQERIRAERETREEERMLISRELHDVLAHSLTLIKVQANAGLIDGATAADALRAIRDESDDALTELRSIVSALRSEDLASVAPQRHIADIPDIIEGFRATGLSITATMPPTAPILTGLTQLSLTRILSEALTNVVRHQGTDARAEVTLEFDDSAFITVESWGTEQRESAGCGAGLVGIAERAQALGGAVETRGDATHFTLNATIPLRRKS